MTTATKLARRLVERMRQINEIDEEGLIGVGYGLLWEAILDEIRDSCPSLNYDRLLKPKGARDALAQ